MTLTLAAARAALRRWTVDTALPVNWTDEELDSALAAALARLDAIAPWAGVVSLAAVGADRLPLPAGVRRVLAVLHQGAPLVGWGVWAGELLLGEPVQGTLEVRCWLERALPTGESEPLPLAGAAEEGFALAAAIETLLAVALARQARWQGPTGPLEAALAAAARERERAARALPRVLRTVPAST